jgi:hypothetical protein
MVLWGVALLPPSLENVLAITSVDARTSTEGIVSMTSEVKNPINIDGAMYIPILLVMSFSHILLQESLSHTNAFHLGHFFRTYHNCSSIHAIVFYCNDCTAYTRSYSTVTTAVEEASTTLAFP